MFSFLPFFFFLLVIFSFAFITEAKVPKAKTFHYLVQANILGKSMEKNKVLAYGDILDISNHPFYLCIIGPDQYPKVTTEMTLALRLDTRLVWEANRGKPVHEKGQLSFRQDGNLVLTEAIGTVIWQTNTANKGVVDLKLLPNGNMVLVDRNGRYVWQSFDHPTNTILVGQSLRPGEQNKLVSRVSISPFIDRNGPYSLVMDGGRLNVYYKSKHSSKAEIYSLMGSVVDYFGDNNIVRMTIESGRDNTEPYLYNILFNFTSADSSYYGVIPIQLKYNTTYSFLHLGQDGNLRIYTYFDKVQERSWDETFTMFSSELYHESECQLPEKCGNFGVCEDNQCVACPTPNGLMGWSRKCSTPKLPSCNNQSTSGINNVDYYRINGIDHFSSNFSGEGPLIFGKCKEKCSKDCTCLGFFYRKETSKCLITSQLNTLTRVSNPSHLAFIKFA